MIGDLPGKGYFLWVLSRCEGGDAAKIVARARAGGAGHLLVKCADGGWEYNERAQIAALVAAGTAEAMPVGGWGYVYNFAVPSCLEVARAQIQRFNLKAWVINAEREMKTPGNAHPEHVKLYVRGCRDAGAAKIYLSSYRYPLLHADFPWQAFLDAGIDAMMPQVYWEQAHNPTSQLERCVTEYAPFKLPVTPTAPGYQHDSWIPTADELHAFLDKALALGLKACNIWTWDYIGKTGLLDGKWKALWNAWASFEWPATQIEPEIPPIAEGYPRLWKRAREEWGTNL